MAAVYRAEVTKYRCSCGRWFPLCRLYFCKYCLSLRCHYCAVSEVDSLFCPNCLENMSSGEARARKNGCYHCYECPCCDQALTVRVVSFKEAYNLSKENLEKLSADSGTGDKEKKVYRLFCQVCSWSSKQAGLPDQIMAANAWPTACVSEEDTLKLRSSSEYFRRLAAIEKLQTDHKTLMPRRKSVFQYLPEKFAFQNVLMRQKLDSAQPQGDGNDVKSTSCVASEEVEPLDESVFTEPVNVIFACSMRQRLKQVETQPRLINDLLPTSKQLIVRKSVRCRCCDHNLIRGEYVPSSIKFKIQFCAILYVPEVRLLRMPDTEKDQFTVYVTVTNFGLLSTSVLLLPDLEEQDNDVQEIAVANYDEPSTYTRAKGGGRLLDPEKSDECVLCAIGRYRKITIFRPIVKIYNHKVIVRLVVKRKKVTEKPMIGFIMKHFCENTLLQPAGEKKEPEMVWLQQHIRIRLYDESTDVQTIYQC